MLRCSMIAAATAAALLGGCGYGYYDRDYGYYDRDYYGGRVAYYDGDYDRYHDPYYDRVNIYYDGYYGPFYDGYWGADGYFYFSDSGGRHWTRDTARHFRRSADSGFMPVRSQHRSTQR